MFQLLQFGATHPCGKMSSKSCMVSPISILEKLLHFVIFIVISDVASFDVCAIKDGKVIGPPQVKCRLLISSIFYEMNFRHLSEMLQIKFGHFQKMSEIHCIKNARN